VFWFRPAHHLKIKIMDHDDGFLNADDFLGQAVFPVRMMDLDQGPVRGWYKLKPEDELEQDSTQDLGEVELSLEMRDGECYKDTMLEVKIIRARNLPAMDYFSGKSDPFLDVKHGAQSFQTHTCFQTLEPEWNSAVVFDYKPLNDIEIEMFDHDDFFFFQSSQYAGQIKIPANTLEYQKPVQQWHSFTDASGISDTNRGELELSICWVDGNRYRNSKLAITVVQARGLKAMDIGGNSDPYPVLKHGKQERKGRKEESTLNPTWQYHSKVEFLGHQALVIEIYDADEASLDADDFMGKCHINVLDVCAKNEPSKMWHALLDSSGKPDTSLGEIEVEVEWLGGSDDATMITPAPGQSANPTPEPGMQADDVNGTPEPSIYHSDVEEVKEVE